MVAGVGIAIEKVFQDGGRLIRGRGYDVASLAIAGAMEVATGATTFRPQD